MAANKHGAALDWRGLLLGTLGTLCLLNGLVALHGAAQAQAMALLGALWRQRRHLWGGNAALPRRAARR